MKRRKSNWFGHIFFRNYLLNEVVEEKIEGRIEVTEGQGRRSKQLLNDLEEQSGSCKRKEEALDRTVWRTEFDRNFGPVVRQITGCAKNTLLICSLQNLIKFATPQPKLLYIFIVFFQCYRYVLLHVMCKHTGKIVRKIFLILLQSSFCVLNLNLPACGPNFCPFLAPHKRQGRPAILRGQSVLYYYQADQLLKSLAGIELEN